MGGVAGDTGAKVVNRKRVQRLMRLAGLVAIYQAAEYEQAGTGAQDLPLPAWGASRSKRVNQVWCGRRHLHPDGPGPFSTWW